MPASILQASHWDAAGRAAKALAQRLGAENISHVFSSPFLRTVETANHVAQLLGLPIKLESGLSEWLNPEWFAAAPEPLSPEVLAGRFPNIDSAYSSRIQARYPETAEQALTRAGRTARTLADEFSGNLLLVGHGASVVGAAWGLVPGSPEVHAAFCCLVRLSRTSQGWSLDLNGDTSHLQFSESALRFH